MITRVGPHRVQHGSIADDVTDLLQGDRVQVLYTDPPWGDGLMRSFATLNRKQTGLDRPALSFAGLLDHLFQLVADYVDGYVFIEMGLQWAPQVWKRCLLAELVGLRSWDLFYFMGGRWRAMVLIGGSTGEQFSLEAIEPSGLSGVALPRHVLATVGSPGAVVFDPCCGMGYTARAAIAAGMTFRGIEPNAARLAKTIGHLERA